MRKCSRRCLRRLVGVVGVSSSSSYQIVFSSSDVWQSDLRDALLVRWFSAQLPPERTHLRQVSFSSFGRDFVILNKEKNP